MEDIKESINTKNQEKAEIKITVNTIKIKQKKFEDLIKDLKKHRKKLNLLISDPRNLRLEVPIWVLSERKAITNLINEIREEFDKEPIKDSELQNAEKEAVKKSRRESKIALIENLVKLSLGLNI